jgi:hypothetical protein
VWPWKIFPRERVVRVLAQAAGGQARKDRGERGLVPRQAVEVGDGEHERADRRDGRDRRRPRLLGEERHLAEHLAGAGALEHVPFFPDLDADLDVSLLDDDEAVPGVPPAS